MTTMNPRKQSMETAERELETAGKSGDSGAGRSGGARREMDAHANHARSTAMKQHHKMKRAEAEEEKGEY